MSTSLLRSLKRERMHVEPWALERSPARVRQRFAHVWAPVDLLLDHLAAWPAGLLAFWLKEPAGHVILTAGESGYVPEPVPWQGTRLQAVARISPADLLDDARPALEVVAHLINHLLGSHGASGGAWLSDGAGVTASLSAVGAQIHALAALGYGPRDPHAYLAWAFAGYWLDRRALNAADPRVERLLRTTICGEPFWERIDGRPDRE